MQCSINNSLCRAGETAPVRKGFRMPRRQRQENTWSLLLDRIAKWVRDPTSKKQTRSITEENTWHWLFRIDTHSYARTSRHAGQGVPWKYSKGGDSFVKSMLAFKLITTGSPGNSRGSRGSSPAEWESLFRLLCLLGKAAWYKSRRWLWYLYYYYYWTELSLRECSPV